MRRYFIVILMLFIMAATLPVRAGEKAGSVQRQTFTLDNGVVRCEVEVVGGRLAVDRLTLTGEAGSAILETDAGFAVDVMWTSWRAPGKKNNADNPVILDNDDFTFVRTDEKTYECGSKVLSLYFSGNRGSIDLCVKYLLRPDDPTARRKVCLSDTTYGLHYLRRVYPIRAAIDGKCDVVKKGGFGQPVAVRMKKSGAFFGYEYPISRNELSTSSSGEALVSCSVEIGERIGADGVESEWAAWAVTPDAYVKKWFMEYVRSIRVAPIRPYTLYNTWYDVRSPEITEDPVTVMNTENLMRIISKFRKNMIEKHGIELDAFVLDDGWDVYKSDWVLRTEEFPGGLRPISDELAKTGTDLGIWFGPIGGYSKRNWRIGWMKEHGYETINDQLCLAGKKYRELFRKRVVDFVEKEGAGYFKWDGIQFSCSEPGHGHPIGIHSRRAVMESVIEMCDAVRAADPDVFLNITSGTWLSPWWVKYANTIWMDGYDYSWADVPSISRRDAAITYRDMVLYEDFNTKDLWFPIANLMTHGIIKGHLQRLGGEQEPLDKFTDNALLYFARGVAMWELYISPDILTDGEWDAIAGAYHWARDRFPILERTEMIGGDPNRREPYGYGHFLGSKGIIAARNPYIVGDVLKMELSPAYGIDPEAGQLVLERVYPTRWISPRLYKAGDTVEIELGGYETAVYEIYPVDEATWPLPADVVFDVVEMNGRECVLDLREATGKIKLLNPDIIDEVISGGETVKLGKLDLPRSSNARIVSEAEFEMRGDGATVGFDLDGSAVDAHLAFLIEWKVDGEEIIEPEIEIIIDGEIAAAKKQGGKVPWAWYSVPVGGGAHEAEIVIVHGEGSPGWDGKISAWLVARSSSEAVTVTFRMNDEIVDRPMPAGPWPAGVQRVNTLLGSTGEAGR